MATESLAGVDSAGSMFNFPVLIQPMEA